MNETKQSEGGWFPFRYDLASQELFKELPARKQVILLDIMNLVGQHVQLYSKGWRPRPEFGQSDQQWSDRLGVNVQTFRDVRYQFGLDVTGKRTGLCLNWFDYRPGHGDRFGNLYRTEYLSARFGQAENVLHKRSAKIFRQTWGLLLSMLTAKRQALNHADVATYCWLAFLWDSNGGFVGLNSVSISKAEIERITGIKIAQFMQSLTVLSKLRPCRRHLFQFAVSRPNRNWLIEVSAWDPLDGKNDDPPPGTQTIGEVMNKN